MNQRIKDGYSIAFFDYKGEKDIVDHLRSIAKALNVEFYEFSIDTCDFCYDPLINLNETGKVEALMNTRRWDVSGADEHYRTSTQLAIQNAIRKYDKWRKQTGDPRNYLDGLYDCLKEYFLPPEAVQVSPLIPFSPMPGGALTANTQMMRDNNILDKFPEVILAMREVVQKGGYGTSVTPVSQFYFQQAFNNVMFGKWKKIAEGYGKMVLGYFGKTPVTPDKEIIKLASEQLGLKPTTKHAVDIADKDESKSLAHVKEILKQNKIKVTEENVFIAAACKEKGIAFLKGEAKVNVRKVDPNAKANEGRQTQSGRYSVVVNGSRYNVEVSEGFNDSIQVKSITEVEGKSIKNAKSAAAGATENDIVASLPGAVHKILVSVGDHVKKGQAIVVLEAMKMEIEVKAPKDGIIGSIEVSKGQSVANNQVVARFK